MNHNVINRNLQHVQMMNRQKNCLRWSENESLKHVLMKLMICMELKKRKRCFMTEAKLNCGGRVDVLDLEGGIAYEVVESESDESIANKASVYPFEVRPVRASLPFRAELLD